MQSITTDVAPELTKISVAGRLDALAAPDLWAEINEAYNSGCYNLIIDLTWASFVDSAGLAALVRAMKQCRSHNADLKLVRPEDDSAFRVFELTKFDSVFEFVKAESSEMSAAK